MANIRQTNSNGGEVAMTVTAGDLARMTTNEQDNGGGYVLAAFAKVTHPRGKCGLGERWEEREVAGTRNVFDGDRPQEVVVCKPPRRRVVQIASGTNPQVCGTLAARDGIKTGSRTPNGQDAGEGKLVVAAFDPYEPGGVKTVHQDGAACTVVNGTSPGHHAAIVDLLDRRTGHGDADGGLLEGAGQDAGPLARPPAGGGAMTGAMTFAPPPVAYGVNATGGMNPCFKETMEVLTANHYSGALIFPKADGGAVPQEPPPTRRSE